MTAAAVPQADSSPKAAARPQARARMKHFPPETSAGDPPRPPCRESFRPGKRVRHSHFRFDPEGFARLPLLTVAGEESGVGRAGGSFYDRRPPAWPERPRLAGIALPERSEGSSAA